MLIMWTRSSWKTQCKSPGIGCAPAGSPAYLIARRLDVDATFGQSRLHPDEKGTLEGVVSG